MRIRSYTRPLRSAATTVTSEYALVVALSSVTDTCSRPLPHSLAAASACAIGGLTRV